MQRRHPRFPLFPYTTLFRSETRLSTWLFAIAKNVARESLRTRRRDAGNVEIDGESAFELHDRARTPAGQDRKSTRLNSSHVKSSYAVFCLKKKKTEISTVKE